MLYFDLALICFKDSIRTAGILIREGVSRDFARTVEVLSLGSKNPTRQPSDLLPYLPSYRSLFDVLVQTVDEMELKILRVPLDDVECITKTVLKVGLKVHSMYKQKDFDSH